MNVDLQELTAAFEKWVSTCRNYPQSHYGFEELSDLNSDRVAFQYATHLMNLLKEGKNV